MLGAVAPYFDVIDKLGEGAFSEVLLVAYRGKKYLYALKKVHIFWIQVALFGLGDYERMCALREALLLAVLKHPNLVYLHECVYDQKEEILYLFLEFLKDGDLKSHKNNTLYFKYCNIWSLIADVAAGLHYLHKNGVVHRDIKPENIIRSHKTYKITDLNVSRTERAGASIGSVVGSPDYFSPEILQGKGYDFKTDIWSFGIIICYLCNLRNPGSLDNVENIPSCYSLALQTLLQNMVAIEADHRYSAEEILIYCYKYGMTENMQSYIMEIGLEDDINNYRFPETKERFVNIIDSFYYFRNKPQSGISILFGIRYFELIYPNSGPEFVDMLATKQINRYKRVLKRRRTAYNMFKMSQRHEIRSQSLIKDDNNK